MSGHEGSTPAAWTTVIILIVASVIGGLAIILGNWVLFFVGGVGLAVVGLIVGKAMSTATNRGSGTRDSGADEARTESSAV